MFENENVAFAVRESLLNVSILLERSMLKIVAVGACTDEERRNYEEFAQHMIDFIEEDALQKIYASHPTLTISRFRFQGE